MSTRSLSVELGKPAAASALPTPSSVGESSDSIVDIVAVGNDIRSESLEVSSDANCAENPWRTDGEVTVTRHISPRYMPEIIFSKR